MPLVGAACSFSMTFSGENDHAVPAPCCCDSAHSNPDGHAGFWAGAREDVPGCGPRDAAPAHQAGGGGGALGGGPVDAEREHLGSTEEGGRGGPAALDLVHGGRAAGNVLKPG